jgi:uncharacterized membrane protein YedE/YeeE
VSRLNAVCLAVGAVFGFLFCASGFNRYDVIHGMLLLRNWSPFLVMGSAVLTAMPLLWLLERRGWTTPVGETLELKRWPVERKHLYGGMVFGVGWAITGACPGSISATLGSGNLVGVITLAGFICGMALRDRFAQSKTAGPDHSPAPEPHAEPVTV